MKIGRTQNEDIDSYIANFPVEVQARLQRLRSTIQKAAPAAAEKISYQIPTFALQGNLVHFAAFKNHIGFYPGAAGISSFASELSGYVFAKGSVQLPFDKPLPVGLISRIVRFRVKQNLEKAAAKAKKKS